MLSYKIKKIYRPEIFQGHNKKVNYFEGWYFKIIDKKSDNIFAIIPGISISNDKNNSHAFIQVMDGKNATSEYFRFNFSDFNYSTEKFEIRIGNNFFSLNNLKLNINQDLKIIKADLKFFNLNFWPKSFLAPGTMGWYAFVPFMECYHSVLSMDHRIKGFANFGGKDIDFSKGRGYIEKDWGVSFPQGWIWLQSNHFNKESTSVMLSIAKIPWRGRHFIGFLCGLLQNKKFNIFATYNGSSIRLLQYSKDSVHVVLENKSYKITINANHQTSAMLLSPIFGAMDGRISESIDAIINIKLQQKINNEEELIYEGTGYSGGLEIINPEVLK
jgi:tocopherol cyclase